MIQAPLAGFGKAEAAVAAAGESPEVAVAHAAAFARDGVAESVCRDILLGNTGDRRGVLEIINDEDFDWQTYGLGPLPEDEQMTAPTDHVGQMVAALEATLIAFGTAASAAFSTAAAFNVAQREIEQVFGPNDVRRVRIPWTSRSVDLDLLIYGTIAVAALLYGGL